jgi:hypothetical protein
MRPKMRIRTGLALGVAALLPALQACYEYVPIEAASPPVGQLVELRITDQGRVGLADRFGTGLDAIEGRVVSEQPKDFVVNVYRVTQIDGASTQWSGETARVDRTFIGSVRGRQFSHTRTALLAAGAAAVVGYFIINNRLIGGYSGPTGDQPPSGPPSTSTRIPLIH